MAKECHKVAFFPISYIKHSFKGKNMVNLASHEQTKVFLNLQTHLLITK